MWRVTGWSDSASCCSRSTSTTTSSLRAARPERVAMRVKTLEIRWHDSKPISTCDFQPQQFKKARPTQDRAFASQAYRLATGGEDNHVRVSRTYIGVELRLSRRAAVDGISQYIAFKRRRGRVDVRGRAPRAPRTAGGIPCDSQQAFCRCERGQVLAHRCVVRHGPAVRLADLSSRVRRTYCLSRRWCADRSCLD